MSPKQGIDDSSDKIAVAVICMVESLCEGEEYIDVLFVGIEAVVNCSNVEHKSCYLLEDVVQKKDLLVLEQVQTDLRHSQVDQLGNDLLVLPYILYNLKKGLQSLILFSLSSCRHQI